MIGIAAMALAAAAIATGTRAPLPRIVSINPCVDAILMQVADPAQIAAISHYSQQPRATSIPLAQARRFKITAGTAEEVVALAPDVVLASRHVAPSTILALRRLGIPLVQVDIPATIGEAQAHIRTIAAAADQARRGTILNARISAAVRAARPPAGPATPALIWQGGGLVPGTRTLSNDLLRTAGFRNLSSDYGLADWDVLPLESLVADPPHVLLTTAGDPRRDRRLGHPVLRPLAAKIALRSYPERLMRCGGPTIIDALARLKQIRDGL